MLDNLKITKEEYLHAISTGVKDALFTMTESGDGFDGPIIREPFLAAIQEGVKDAIYDAMPAESKILDMFYAGVRNK